MVHTYIEFLEYILITLKKSPKNDIKIEEINMGSMKFVNAFSKNVKNKSGYVVRKLQSEVINIIYIEKLAKTNFQPDPCAFDCRTSVKQYLNKAKYLLIKIHDKSPQKSNCSLTNSIKAIFLFYAA